MIKYKIEAFWDSVAEVWVATSGDISGLVTEAENMEILIQKIRVMIPELLTINEGIKNINTEIQWELITHHQELITIAS
jgi:Domain of unknown function (DUF1902)